MPLYSWQGPWAPATLCPRLQVMQRRLNKPEPWALMRSSISPEINSAKEFVVSRGATVRIL